MHEKPHVIPRRAVLGTTAAAGVAVAAAAWVAPRVQQAAQPAGTPLVTDTQRGGGYRLSEHVKHYYRTARI
jgi:hypothetical protein